MTTAQTMEIKCPQCRIGIDLDTALIGTLHHCKQCNSNFVVPATPVVSGSVLGKFWVQKKLGASIRSDVFIAKQVEDGQKVVVKFFSPCIRVTGDQIGAYCDRFRDETFELSPRIVAVEDAGVNEGIPYIAMPYYSSEDLHQHLRRVGNLQEPRLIEIAMACAEALDVLWRARSWAHGMIKPTNIMLVNMQEVMLTDFGLSDFLTSAKAWPAQPDPELNAYRSPECRLQNECTYQSDIYSLGASLYHLATGAKPVAMADAGALLDTSDERLFPPADEINPNITPRFAEILDRMLRLDPDARPASWAEFIAELNDLQSSQLSTQILRVRGDDGQLNPVLADAEEEAASPKEEPPITEPKPARKKSRRRRHTTRRLALASRLMSAQAEQDTPRWIVPFLAVALVTLLVIFGSIAYLQARKAAERNRRDDPASIQKREEERARLEKLERDFLTAETYERNNPKDPAGAMKLFKEIRLKGVGTKYQKMAHIKVLDLRKLVNEMEKQKKKKKTAPKKGAGKKK